MPRPLPRWMPATRAIPTCGVCRNSRAALADYLTALHARPVAEERIQITASGMTAVSVALAATVRAGDRVVLHSPSWPNVGNAARLRGAQVDELDLTALPDGRFRMDLDRLDAMLEGARAFILNSPNNPTGWTATRDELVDDPGHRASARRLADLGRGLFAPGLRRRAGRAVAAGHRRDRRPRDRVQQLLQDLDDDRLAARLAGGAGGHARRRSPNWWK